MQCLDEDVSVIIFPENSDEGYSELPEQFHRGFLLAAKLYLSTRGEDIPIYPTYYSPAQNKAFIGEPLYYGEMARTMTEDDMCDEFVRRIRMLAGRYGGDRDEIADHEIDEECGTQTV